MRWKIRLISSHSLWRLNAALAEDEQFFSSFPPFPRRSLYFLVLIEFSSIISLKLNRNLNCMDQLFFMCSSSSGASRRRNKKMGLSAGWWWRFYSYRKDLEIGKHKRRIFQRLLRWLRGNFSSLHQQHSFTVKTSEKLLDFHKLSS